MIKDYRVMLALAFVGVVALGMSLFKEMQQDFVRHQKAYYHALEVEDFSVELRQIKAIVAGAEKDPHDFGKIGCVVCHDGNGRALAEHDAHGEYHGWPAPLLAGKIAQANCNRCHAMESGSLAGAELYLEGQRLFLEKACWGCHTIAGISSTSQAPELTDAGGKFTYEYLVESIQVPSANIANSKMPTFDWIHDEHQVAALATYLKGQQKDRLRSAESTPIGYVKPVSELAEITEVSAEVGRSLFVGAPVNGKLAKGGCINCHAFRSGEGVVAGGNIGPELTWSVRARGLEYVQDHIRNARTHVADSVMPTFKDYTDVEIESLGAYLAMLDYKPLADTPGHQLFDLFCVSCHGKDLDGRGVVSGMLDPLPRDFSKHQFVSTYESRFKDSIRDGVKGTAMPAWKEVLSDKDVEKLIAFIREQSLKDEDHFTPKVGDLERRDYKNKGLLIEAGNPEKGYETFQQACTSCHGKLANGKGPNAYDLEHPLPRNLLNKEFLNQASVSDERLYQSILLGVAGTPMPAHDHLKDQTILDVIAFIRGNITEESK